MTDMALIRCQMHGNPEGVTRKYVMSVKPVGYPDTAAICGRKDCLNPGLVWLDEDEVRAYRTGWRVFSVPNAGVKVQVS